jgi:cytochrome b subunit of formate dehydrogenase
MALGIAVLAVVLFITAMVVAQEDNDWLWPVAGVVGGVAAYMGWNAGRPRPQGKSLAAVTLGGLVLVVIVVWIIWALATGNF